MGEHHAVVAIYKTHTDAQAGIKELKRAACTVTKLSIVGKDYHTDKHVVGYYNTGDHMKYWGTAITGIGSVLIAGPLLRWVIDAFEEVLVTGGMTAIGVAFYNTGIPRDSISKYETALRSSQFLLLVNGTAKEVAHASTILQATRVRSVNTHGSVDKEATVS